MRTSTVLSEGARQVLRRWKLIPLFYLANLAAALVLVLPIAAALRSQLAHSLESDRLFTNLDPAWVSEMAFQNGAVPFTAFGVTAAVLAVFFLVLNTFLAGGAISIFHRDEDTFFGSCARYFPRFLRLLLISLALYAVVFGISGGISAGIARLRENSMEARPWTILNWARLLLFVFLLGTVNMIFDYAKIACVVEERRSALKSALRGLRFVWSNLRRTLAIYWTCSAIGLLFLLAYHGLSELIGQNTPVTILVLLLVRQAYTAARMWTRLWTWSDEVQYYESTMPVPQTFSSTIVAPEPPSLAAAG